MCMKNKFFQRLGGGFLEQTGLGLWNRLQFTSLNTRKDKRIVGLLRDIHRQRRSLLSAYEGYFIYSLAKSQTGRPGAFAEVGVYKGGSAKLICEAKGDKTFHAFDTFEGLPPSCDSDRGVHRDNQYAFSLEAVQEYLQGYDNLHFHKGLFPKSAEGLGGSCPTPSPISTLICMRARGPAWSISIPA